MKYNFILFCCFIILSCNTAERDCLAYKTGVFSFKYTLNGTEKEAHFKRTEDYSIDYFDNKIDTSSIRWINDCEFILKKQHPKTLADKDAVHFKILTTTDTSYAFEYKLVVKKLNAVQRTEKGIAYKADESKIAIKSKN